MNQYRPDPRHPRGRTAVARTGLAVVLAVVLAGCGLHRMPDGTLMDDSGMPATAPLAQASAAQPSAAAAMICSDEIHTALQHNLGLPAAPSSRSRWAGGTYTCTYQLPEGELVVSVQDATDQAAGRRYFDTVTARIPGLQPLRGLPSLGLPAQQNDAGDVLFLKDGKTLLVDATALPATVGAYHQTPTDVAYALAAAILACWSEH